VVSIRTTRFNTKCFTLYPDSAYYNKQQSFPKQLMLLVFLKEQTVFSVRYGACGVCGGQSTTGAGFFLRTFAFPPVNIILRLHIVLTRKTNWQSLGIFQKAAIFRKSKSIGQKRTFTFI
jgi:hypothetical protein